MMVTVFEKGQAYQRAMQNVEKKVKIIDCKAIVNAPVTLPVKKLISIIKSLLVMIVVNNSE